MSHSHGLSESENCADIIDKSFATEIRGNDETETPPASLLSVDFEREERSQSDQEHRADAQENLWANMPEVDIQSQLDAMSTSSRAESSWGDTNLHSCCSSALGSSIRSNVMVNWLHSKQEEKLWTNGDPGEGVVLKLAKGQYVSCPDTLRIDGTGFFEAIVELNVRVAMTVNTRVIKLIMSNLKDLPYVELTPGLRLQVIPDIKVLQGCRKHQSAALVASQKILIVWGDTPKLLLERAQYVEETLMRVIWGNEMTCVSGGEKGISFGEARAFEEEVIEADDSIEEKPRRTVFLQHLQVAATLIILFGAIGSGWRNLVMESLIDKYYIRLALVACIIPQVWLSLFFFQALVGNIIQLIGPIGQMRENTKYYSGLPPRRIARDRESGLPHVTIQMPVYKEGLSTVIEPTVRSLKAAISTYELQGGTANIFINDDGMQLISCEDAKARQDFYDENNIGWVARPKHNPKNGGFTRGGKFKKASNMNYALWTSVAIEEKLSAIERHARWDQWDENKAYSEALRQVIEKRNGETWADGNIRIGDYILLVDSDTRVPEDCFLEAVSEMENSPQVAIIQYSSGVMNVTWSFFERGITFFTNLIYTQIRYAVANGDVAPFVGHNAILRWQALQKIAYNDKHSSDNREKYWSERTVSEDFDMALRLQTHGYLVRLAAYKGDGFKEGVSLTVYDELARWEKYAYGCSELIFHPFHQWPTKGIFTKLFRKFILSNMPLPSKITIMAYVSTYYAIGSAWLLTLLNYFLVGWFNGYLDHYYVDSFKVYFSIFFVFTALGNVSLAVMRYRIGEQGIVSALWLNIRWIPLLLIFLGGVSLHVSQALLCHLFNINMTWGATAKEVENVSFFEEIPRIIKRFKWTFLFTIGAATAMIVMATIAPPMWRITSFTPIWPLASTIVGHFVCPIVLNPNLMLFTW